VTLCIIIFSLTSIAFANTAKYYWKHVTSSKVAYIYTPGTQLNSDYNGSVFYDGLNKWNNTTANFRIYYLYPGASQNVAMISVDSTVWTNNGWGSSVYAWTKLWREDGTPCNNNFMENPNTVCENKYVNLAAIYFNNGFVPNSADERKKVVAHELGHVVALEHTTYLTSSIMKSKLSECSLNPTSYDIGQINSMYHQ
jgi:hypothetical protein